MLKTCELKTKIECKTIKNDRTFQAIKKFYFFCIYKMYLISTEWYKNAGVDMLIIKKLAKFGQLLKLYTMV